MNGAPRIAPTPTSSVASPPPPKTMAMIGIIVSGSAVPTAASTDPTAPCARLSLRPNHSIPLVNSSAPARMTTNAMARTTMSTSAPQSDGGHDRGEHDQEHEQRDQRHPAVVGPPGSPTPADHDPPDGQGDDRGRSRPTGSPRAAGRASPTGSARGRRAGRRRGRGDPCPSRASGRRRRGRGPSPATGRRPAGGRSAPRGRSAAPARAEPGADALTGPAPGWPSGWPCRRARRRTASAGPGRRCGARPASRRTPPRTRRARWVRR